MKIILQEFVNVTKVIYQKYFFDSTYQNKFQK